MNFSDQKIEKSPVAKAVTGGTLAASSCTSLPKTAITVMIQLYSDVSLPVIFYYSAIVVHTPFYKYADSAIAVMIE